MGLCPGLLAVSADRAAAGGIGWGSRGCACPAAALLAPSGPGRRWGAGTFLSQGTESAGRPHASPRSRCGDPGPPSKGQGAGFFRF